MGRVLAGIAARGCRRGALVELHAQAASRVARIAVRSFRVTPKKWTLTPRDLAELEERLDLIHSLKRKYGATLAEVIAFGDEAKQKLQSLESATRNWRGSTRELEKLDAEMLRRQRTFRRAQKVIPQLAKAVGKQLEDLGFKQSKFDVAITTDS